MHGGSCLIRTPPPARVTNQAEHLLKPAVSVNRKPDFHIDAIGSIAQLTLQLLWPHSCASLSIGDEMCREAFLILLDYFFLNSPIISDMSARSL
jgi:hypothetical protein